MKSLTAVCPTGVGAGSGAMPAINAQGRAIGRHQHPHRENAEMKMYLSKLKDLVPFMPKNRKLSKLEIIQHVIDYICDLQSELETHPEMGTFDAASALNFAAAQNLAMDDDDEEEDIAAAEEEEDVALEQVAGDALTQRLNAESYHQQQHHQQLQQQSSLAVTRQPLVDRQAPNTILPACNSNSNSNNSSSNFVAAHQQQFPQQHQPQQQPQQSPQNSQTVG